MKIPDSPRSATLGGAEYPLPTESRRPRAACRPVSPPSPQFASAMARVVELGCGLGNRLYSMSSELKTYPNTTFIWAPDFGLHFNESAKTAPPPSKTCSSPRNPYPHCL